MASTSNPWFREKNLIKAQIAIDACRFDHALQFMKEIVKSIAPWAELSSAERKLLSTTLKKFLDDHRKAWNELNSKTSGFIGIQSEVAKFYLSEIADQILKDCRKMKQFIYSWLILSARSAEALVFYLTLNADVSTYLVELEEDDVEVVGEAAILAYKDAKAVARARLTWASPARLMLALHRAEFYSEVMEMPEKGVKIARKAMVRARKATSTLSDEELKKEINELVAKLAAHISTWKNDEDQGGTSTSGPIFDWWNDPRSLAPLPDNFNEAGISAPQTEPGAKVGTPDTFSMPFVPYNL